MPNVDTNKRKANTTVLKKEKELKCLLKQLLYK